MIGGPNQSPTGSAALPSWERLGAAVIDFLVLFVIEVIAAVPIAGRQYSRLIAYARGRNAASLAKNSHFIALDHQFLVQLVHFGLVSAALTAVYLIGMYLAAGATLGKLALGLRITRIDGRPMTVRDAVLRSVVFWVGNPFIPIIGVWIWLLQYVGGTLVILLRPDHRGPEDLIGRTMVVRKADQGRSLLELTGLGPPAVPPASPPDPSVTRSGHLPGWGPAPDQSPPPPELGREEAPG